MNILVPTDFSSFADAALKMACQVALKFGAKLHIYNATNLPEEWEDLPLEEKAKDNVHRAIAISTKSKLIEKEKIAESLGVKSTSHYTGGPFLKNIEEVIQENNIDLIVMGSKGASGKKEWFIGSNAQKVIRNIHLNTMIVKEEHTAADFKKVLFASNLTLKDKESFKHFLEFLKPFDIEEIHILAVDTFGFFSQPSPIIYEALSDFKSMVKGTKCETHFISDYSVDSGIRNFTNERGINLIGISNNNRNPIKRMFQGSNVEILVNHSDVPVLSIDHENASF